MNDYRIIPSIVLLCLLAFPIQQSVAQEACGAGHRSGNT